MFTGLVEGIGKVVRLSSTGHAAQLRLDMGALGEDVRLGDSVAVNGACLTATGVTGRTVAFDVSAETLRVTTLEALKPGDEVNLERSLRVGDRLGGHFVLGHVDGVGEIVRLEKTSGQTTLEVRVQPELIAALIPKGSIAVDGISLTLAGLLSDRFSVAIIPTTLQKTALRSKSAGDRVNIEMDVLGKHVARLLGRMLSSETPQTGGGLTEGFLSRHGF